MCRQSDLPRREASSACVRLWVWKPRQPDQNTAAVCIGCHNRCQRPLQCSLGRKLNFGQIRQPPPPPPTPLQPAPPPQDQQLNIHTTNLERLQNALVTVPLGTLFRPQHTGTPVFGKTPRPGYFQRLTPVERTVVRVVIGVVVGLALALVAYPLVRLYTDLW